MRGSPRQLLIGAIWALGFIIAIWTVCAPSAIQSGYVAELFQALFIASVVVAAVGCLPMAALLVVYHQPPLPGSVLPRQPESSGPARRNVAFQTKRPDGLERPPRGRTPPRR